jgi:predicted ATP-grasp superfamily ATP-dependent carboligase
MPWLMHALSCATYKYINVNNMTAVSSYLVGYIVSKAGVYYSTDDDNVAILYSHINMNRVDNAVAFLERSFGGKE